MKSANITIRQENKADWDDVRAILDEAFAQKEEGLLVDKLKKHPDFIPELSLVAEIADEVIGYILFTPLKIINGNLSHDGLALAPMAVKKVWQKRGVGSLLINKGLEIAKSEGHEVTIVLGHENYYPRFGFKPASRWGIKAPFPVPDPYFMALALIERGLDNKSGTVKYLSPFEEL